MGIKKKYENSMIKLIIVYIGMIMINLIMAIICLFMHRLDNPWIMIALFLMIFISCVIGLVSTIYGLINMKKTEREFSAVIPYFNSLQEEMNIETVSDFYKSIQFVLRYVKESKERQYEMEYEKKQAEISNLQSQINPHFLYNVLETIRSEAIIHQDMDAAAMAEALGNYFRYNISKKKDVVSLVEELDNVANYIGIQKYRFKDRIDYEVVFHEDEDHILHAQMPKLSLQPIVENAIYHGIEKRLEGGKVTVHITQTQKRLIILVQDNGLGMEKESVDKINQNLNDYNDENSNQFSTKHGGIALRNINQRIKMLYGDHYGMTVSSVTNLGTEVEITIPLIIQKD